MKFDVDAVLFDNDGTLVDTYWGIIESFKKTMKAIFNEDNPDIIAFSKLVGLPLSKQFERYTDNPDLVKKMCANYRSYHSELNLNNVDCFEGIPEMLHTLKISGKTLGVVTSKLRATCISGLENNNIWKYFDYLQSVQDWPVHKPDPGALSHACDELNLPYDRVMYVGDSPYDIMSASGAGCLTCGVTYGKFFDRQDLEKYNPSVIIDHPSELVNLLI